MKRTWKRLVICAMIVGISGCTAQPTSPRRLVTAPGAGKTDSYVNTAAKEYAFSGTALIEAPSGATEMSAEDLDKALRRGADSKLSRIASEVSSHLRKTVTSLNETIPKQLPEEIAKQIEDEDAETKRNILENWRTQQEVSAFSRSTSKQFESIEKTEDGRYRFSFKLEFVLSNRLASTLFPVEDGSGQFEIELKPYYGASVQPEAITVSARPSPSTDSFPKYREMFSDGKLEIAIHIGGDYNTDEVKICCTDAEGKESCEKKSCSNSCNNDPNPCTQEPPTGCTKELVIGRIDRYTAEELVNSLKKNGFQHSAATYKDLKIDSPPFVKTIPFDGFDLEVRVRIVYPEIVPCGEERKLVDAMKESLKTADVVVYAGHAGPGAGFILDYQPRTELDDRDWTSLEMPDKYQMIFMYGCETYSTYADAMYANPSKHDGNLDVVTTANTMWTNMGLPGVTTVIDGLLLRDPSTKRHIPVSWTKLLMWLNVQEENGHTHYGVHGVDASPKLSPWSDRSSLCKPCKSDVDCPGGGNFCITYGDGTMGCGMACTTDEACGTGYQCYQIPGEEDTLYPKLCVPNTFSCAPPQ